MIIVVSVLMVVFVVLVLAVIVSVIADTPRAHRCYETAFRSQRVFPNRVFRLYAGMANRKSYCVDFV